MTKLRVAVLMGGKSPEHEVSLVTGRGVVDNLDKNKYEVIPIVISKTGRRWNIYDLNQFNQLNFEIGRKVKHQDQTQTQQETFTIPIEIKPAPDVFFIAMHGPYGEDGTIQGMLDFLGAKYTGAGVLGSALGMNKIAFKRVIENAGLPTPSWKISHQDQTNLYQKAKELSPSQVIKPIGQGSSVGINLAHNKSDFQKAAKQAFKYGNQILVEEYIKGTEVSCGVLGNTQPFALPVIEICPDNEFFDYESKYTPGMCEEIVPARISQELTKKVQEYAVEVFKVTGCKGFGRVDMIIRDNQPYILEINTIPGLTPTSLLPQEAKAAGISYPELLDKVIGFALEE